MGDMAEYYDDRAEAEVYNAKTDQWLPAGDPRLPKPRRSDAYYHRNKMTPPKGKPVALTPKQKLRRLEAELDKNLDLQHVLKLRADELRAEIKKADLPSPPPSGAGNMFRVEVQFASDGAIYSYLLTRSGQRWYTTGTKDDQKLFESWQLLCEWLNSTYWHGALDVLKVDAPRQYPTDHTMEVPF